MRSTGKSFRRALARGRRHAAGGRDTHGTGLVLAIGAFKLLKAALLVVAGVLTVLAVRHGAAAEVVRVADALRADPGNRFFHAALARAVSVRPESLARLGVGTFAYALVFAVEGVGLLLRRKWAEWLTVVVTASFIPLEVYELARKFTAVRAAAIVLNLGILAYLLVRRLHDRGPGHDRAATPRRWG